MLLFQGVWTFDHHYTSSHCFSPQIRYCAQSRAILEKNVCVIKYHKINIIFITKRKEVQKIHSSCCAQGKMHPHILLCRWWYKIPNHSISRDLSSNLFFLKKSTWKNRDLVGYFIRINVTSTIIPAGNHQQFPFYLVVYENSMRIKNEWIEGGERTGFRKKKRERKIIVSIAQVYKKCYYSILLCEMFAIPL